MYMHRRLRDSPGTLTIEQWACTWMFQFPLCHMSSFFRLNFSSHSICKRWQVLNYIFKGGEVLNYILKYMYNTFKGESVYLYVHLMIVTEFFLQTFQSKSFFCGEEDGILN